MSPDGKALVSIKQRELVEQRGAGRALPALKRSIVENIHDLLAAFATQHRTDDEKVRVFRLYGEAVQEFEEAIANEALRGLIFDNPHNPFPPTPQDVRKRCGVVENRWINLVGAYFLQGASWDEPRHGPPPLTPGAYVSPKWVARRVPHYMKMPVHSTRVEKLSSEVLRRLPECLFEPEMRENLLHAAEEREAAWARLESLKRHVDARFSDRDGHEARIAAAIVDSSVYSMARDKSDMTIEEFEVLMPLVCAEVEEQRQDDRRTGYSGKSLRAIACEVRRMKAMVERAQA